MGNLPVIYGNGNIPNLTGNFRTLLLILCCRLSFFFFWRGLLTRNSSSDQRTGRQLCSSASL